MPRLSTCRQIKSKIWVFAYEVNGGPNRRCDHIVNRCFDAHLLELVEVLRPFDEFSSGFGTLLNETNPLILSIYLSFVYIDLASLSLSLSPSPSPSLPISLSLSLPPPPLPPLSLSLSPYTSLSVHPSIRLSIYPFIHAFIQPQTCKPVNLFNNLCGGVDPPMLRRVVGHKEDSLALFAEQRKGLGDVRDRFSVEPDHAVTVEEERVVAAGRRIHQCVAFALR